MRLKVQAQAGQVGRRQPAEQLQAPMQGGVGFWKVSLRLGGLSQEGAPGGTRERQARQRAALQGSGQGGHGAEVLVIVKAVQCRGAAKNAYNWS